MTVRSLLLCLCLLPSLARADDATTAAEGGGAVLVATWGALAVKHRKKLHHGYKRMRHEKKAAAHVERMFPDADEHRRRIEIANLVRRGMK